MIIRFFGILILLLASACTSVVEQNSPAGQILAAFGPQQLNPRFVQLQKANVPAMQIALIDRGINTLVLLEGQRGDFKTWLSPDGASLITERGMLVGTRALGDGLMSSDVSQSLNMVLSRSEGWSDRFHSYLTGNDEIETRTYRCLIELRGARELNLGPRTAQTTLMRETCRSIDQSFFNLYWVENGTGRIVQSRQWPGEFVGALSTRVVE